MRRELNIMDREKLEETRRTLFGTNNLSLKIQGKLSVEWKAYKDSGATLDEEDVHLLRFIGYVKETLP